MLLHEVNAVADEIMSILEGAKAEGKLQGFDLTKGAGRYDDSGFRMKLNVTPQRSDADRQNIAESTDDEMVRNGFAPPGTPVMCGDQRGEIIKRRRTRYLVKGIGGKWNGQEFTTRFGGARLLA